MNLRYIRNFAIRQEILETRYEIGCVSKVVLC